MIKIIRRINISNSKLHLKHCEDFFFFYLESKPRAIETKAYVRFQIQFEGLFYGSMGKQYCPPNHEDFLSFVSLLIS